MCPSIDRHQPSSTNKTTQLKSTKSTFSNTTTTTTTSTTTTRNSRRQHTKPPTFFPPSTLRITPPSAITARPPLHRRDRNQNAPPLIPPQTRPRIITPPFNTNTMPDRRQPQLAKTLSRAPLTPKVASKPPQPSVAVSPSPLPRRSQTHKDRDECATPVTQALLSTNITSRSGSRQSRVDSANTTPSGTPVPDKGFDGWDNKGDLGVSTLTLDDKRSASRRESLDKKEEKFFYASDTKKTITTTAATTTTTTTATAPTIRERPASLPQKPATFFYANGSSADAKRITTPPTFTPVLASTPEPVASKFFYANGAPDYISSQRPSLTTSVTAPTVSTSRLAPARPTSSLAQGSTLARPVSPVKGASPLLTAPSLQSSAMPPTATNRSAPATITPATNPSSKRRVSIEVPPRPKATRGHARTGSVPSLEPLTVPKFARSPQRESESAPISPGVSRPAMTMASILQAAQDLNSDDENKDSDFGAEDSQAQAPQSPAKSGASSNDASSIVANARRERKVQDLEITNASLEAINRTLERQLRKQQAELRRYRRLSRSGRFSFTSTAASSRTTSATHTEPPISLSDLSEEESEYSQSESDFSDTSSTKSGSSPNSKMAARRKRDEIRLQLDLTKHQELLIDSQKINQSIKRCLDWTEVLIKEGVKALEYKVKVSDVGGQVLLPLEDDRSEFCGEDDTITELDYASSDKADEMMVTEIEAPMGDNVPNTASSLEPPWSKGAQDRDSGIELPRDGGPDYPVLQKGDTT